MTAVLLALFTAITYGVANYLGPVLTRTHPLGAVLLVGQTVGVAGAGVLLAVEGGGWPETRYLVLGLLAGVSNAGALAAFYTAAAAGPISIVAPIGATGAVVPVVAALVTGERPAAVQLAGIPLAVLGVALAAARDPGGRGGRATRRTLVVSVAGAALFGGFLALFGAASDGGPWQAVFSSRVSLVVCTAAVLLARRAPVGVPAGDVGRLAVPGVLLLLGTAAYATASTQGLTSVVAVLATLSPVVTVGMAVVLLGERLAPRQRVGVATALVGVVLLAAG